MPTEAKREPSLARHMLNKVPEVTLYFWLIKVLCTTVGETAADFLNVNLNLGLKSTSVVMSALLLVALFFQLRSKRYVPGLYWIAVVLISVVGTLITDNLIDNLGISLPTTTVLFSVALAAVFGAWYASEKTLSVHTIITTKREVFYWFTILFTFALGTSTGDLIAERFDLGYLVTLLIFAGLIVLIGIARGVFKVNAIFAFWAAYIFTRPLGASLGDFLSQDRSNGGLGLVVYLAVTKRDVIAGESSVQV